jgi:hypothetical protein
MAYQDAMPEAAKTNQKGGIWDQLAAMVVIPSSQGWSKICSFCSTTLLFIEQGGWCCGQGRYRLPRLPLSDNLLDPLLQRYEGQLSRMSRRLNNLFAFSAIGSTGRFVPSRDLRMLSLGVILF